MRHRHSLKIQRSIKHLFVLIYALFPLTLQSAQLSVTDQAAAGLVRRIIPKHANHFLVDTSLPQISGKDTFTLSDSSKDSSGAILLLKKSDA